AEVGAAAAEADLRVGVAADVEDLGVLEDGGVAVGGAVEDDDLVVFLDVLAAEHLVAGGGAAEEVDGGDPADDLVGGRGGEGGVGDEAGPLVGVFEEGEHAARGRVAGGLVAGDDEEEDEEVELVLGERLAVLVGLQEFGDDVVARVGAALGGQFVGVGVHLGGGGAAFVGGGGEVGVLGADHAVGPVED